VAVERQVEAEGEASILMQGRVTGLEGGRIVGWVAAAEGGEDAYLEAVADGEGPFGRARAEPGQDGRLHFAIPLPDAFRDGRMRFLDVRPLGSERPLDGGPVIHDGGLFAPAAPGRRADADPETKVPLAVEGQVRFTPPGAAEGWAQAPDEPDRRLRLEILADGRFITAITADQGLGDAARSGHGFRVDLSRLLRRGPFEIEIRVCGYEQPLPGGRFRAGPFARDGEVDCPGYLDDEASRSLLASLPFEHLAFEARRITPARLAPRLINRLRRERFGLSAGAPPATLLMIPGGPEGEAGSAWALQSLPGAALAGPGEPLPEAGYVFFARSADLLHPSAAAILARMDGPDVVSWSRFCADERRAGAPGTVLRRPRFDVVTARHGATTDTTLAVKAEVLAKAPQAVFEALAAGRMHPLWFWLAGQPLDWRMHPEALTSSIGPAPDPPSREEAAADEVVLRELLAEEGGAFTLESLREDLPWPHVLVPARRAGVVSVLVPFRGRSAMTLGCIMSLGRQRLSGELELVLVDNQSAPEEAQAVLEGARKLLGEERVTALAYDAPFNHSAQNNLAARAARGEAIVLCNNDVALEEPDLIEQLTAWALQPGVGTVGCRLEDPERGLGSYGLRWTTASADPFQPPLRETDEGAFGRFVHAVPGNTLALAAMSRERFLDLGGLDETRFAAGYNDLDLMLRASAAGLTHLYLGHVGARHARGSSRTGDNEDLQALWLNQDYPVAPAQRLAQLGNVRIERAPAPRPSEEEARLRAQLQARRAQELTRAEAARLLLGRS
jgi:GT2 family glycosyltransferase